MHPFLLSLVSTASLQLLHPGFDDQLLVDNHVAAPNVPLLMAPRDHHPKTSRIPTALDVPWLDTAKSDLNVTLGSVSQTDSGFLTVVGPKERAHRKGGSHDDAMLQFRYRGPSDKTSRLSSGLIRRQIGLKMRAMNSCNLLYVMWRIEPVEQIVITVKSNPGKKFHDDCGTSGYHEIAAVPVAESGVSATSHKTRRLRVRINDQAGRMWCTVIVDGRTIWTGMLPSDLMAPIHGPVGFRSDNGSFIFKLLVAPDSSKVRDHRNN